MIFGRPLVWEKIATFLPYWNSKVGNLDTATWLRGLGRESAEAQ